MYLLYCDETNLEERAGDFLIYGGLMIGADQVLNLSLSLDALRHEHDVPPEYSLKFNPGPRHFLTINSYHSNRHLLSVR